MPTPLRAGNLVKDGEYYLRIFAVNEEYVFVSTRHSLIKYVKNDSSVWCLPLSATNSWVQIDEEGNPVKERWQPKEHDRVWTISLTEHDVFEEPYLHTYADKQSLELGLILPTREQAEKRLAEVQELLKSNR